jgi:multidrug resistance protein
MAQFSPAHSSSSKSKSKTASKGSGFDMKIAILMLVMVVNALAYGVIIPLLYPYASRFGINPFSLGLLFASFSLAQLISTPILGRLSDKFGRRPVLLFCLAGTALSLFMFAGAKSVLMLFVARIIDGVTGGNNSVAQAMVADSTEGPARAKAFGLLGAAFGFGFLIGPALGGILSQYGLTVPFWFGGILAAVGTVLGIIFLPETLPKQAKKVAKSEPLFNFGSLGKALFAPYTGLVLGISLITAIALNVFILGFQSFTVDILKLPATQVGLLFALFGFVSIIMQAVGLRWLLSVIPSKKIILTGSMIVCAVVMAMLSRTTTFYSFMGVLVFYMIANAPQLPLVSALLSERSRPEDQGGILGINQSYVSLGQIIGPLVAGYIAVVSVPLVFMVGAGVYLLATFATIGLYRKGKPANL